MFLNFELSTSSFDLLNQPLEVVFKNTVCCSSFAQKKFKKSRNR